MRSKKWLLFLLVVFAAFAVISVTLANDTVSRRTRNVITTGKVDITINEKTTATNGIARADGSGIDFTDVLPGNTVEKIVTVTNKDEKCWLLVKIDVIVDPEPDDGSEPTALIVPNVDKTLWNYSDGYYYYVKALEKNETVSLFDEVSFDSLIGNAYIGSKAKMTITAEAAQYVNNEDMSPDSWPDNSVGGAR